MSSSQDRWIEPFAKTHRRRKAAIDGYRSRHRPANSRRRIQFRAPLTALLGIASGGVETSSISHS
jgi:hypothetical protein